MVLIHIMLEKSLDEKDPLTLSYRRLSSPIKEAQIRSVIFNCRLAVLTIVPSIVSISTRCDVKFMAGSQLMSQNRILLGS